MPLWISFQGKVSISDKVLRTIFVTSFASYPLTIEDGKKRGSPVSCVARNLFEKVIDFVYKYLLTLFEG